ncbi:MAG: galactokinase [Candidatus Aminicenantes bacterium]
MVDRQIAQKLLTLAAEARMEIKGGRLIQTSSRFCLGVEHGDYNGTELFGVGADRYVWIGYKPNGSKRFRFFSGNFSSDGVIEFESGSNPVPLSPDAAKTWGRFAYGVNFILKREGFNLRKGMDAVIYGNIPGGGMSRSASLTINLILSVLDANRIRLQDKFRVADLAQAVENDYIGSPCGLLDQIMILFARKDMGTHFNPAGRTVKHFPFGNNVHDFRIIGLDTGTDRPGLENSTYKIRREECQLFVSLLQKQGYKIKTLSDIKEDGEYREIVDKFSISHPHLCSRLKYIFFAQKRFSIMLDAWQKGDIATVGRIFREDGISLRDDYKISGPELESMCDIASTVEGVYGERMLGGGEKGTSGAILSAESVEPLRRAVNISYPRRHPEYKDKYAVHVFNMVDGVQVFDGVI